MSRDHRSGGRKRGPRRRPATRQRRVSFCRSAAADGNAVSHRCDGRGLRRSYRRPRRFGVRTAKLEIWRSRLASLLPPMTPLPCRSGVSRDRRSGGRKRGAGEDRQRGNNGCVFVDPPLRTGTRYRTPLRWSRLTPLLQDNHLAPTGQPPRSYRATTPLLQADAAACYRRAAAALAQRPAAILTPAPATCAPCAASIRRWSGRPTARRCRARPGPAIPR